jgi:hypothetical protein
MNNKSDISIHDNFLLGYEVDASKREIVLRTEFRDSGEAENTDVIFSEVAAYHFTNDSFGTILFGIDVVDSNQIFHDNWTLFEAGWKRSGWPGEWGTSKEKASAYFAQNAIRGFYIGSSIGMSGWVLAKTMEMRSKS